MANELAELTDRQRKWLSDQGISEDTWRALRASLFPSAQGASIQLYWHYCQARKLDPMKKPAHIVPMKVKQPGSDQYSWQDVIMPGIAEARITANRTGQYAGQDEPEFGPEIELRIGKVTMFAPEYCTVRVHRMMGQRVCTFAHTEYFREAVSTKNDGDPNAMWRKRPRGQLAKCAEAGALRKGFPEELGGTITADEADSNAEPIDVTPVQSGRGRADDALRTIGKSRPREDEPAAAERVEPKKPEPRADDEPAAQAGRSEGAAPLLDHDGSQNGEYRRAGSFLNALVKLLTSHDDAPERVQAVYENNKPTLDQIRDMGNHDDKIADVESLVAKLTTRGPDEDWVGQYDAASQTQPQPDDEIVANIREGLEEAVERGDEQAVRARIASAQHINDSGLQDEVLDELDDALARAQAGGENAARGAFGDTP